MSDWREMDGRRKQVHGIIVLLLTVTVASLLFLGCGSTEEKEGRKPEKSKEVVVDLGDPVQESDETSAVFGDELGDLNLDLSDLSSVEDDMSSDALDGELADLQ